MNKYCTLESQINIKVGTKVEDRFYKVRIKKLCNRKLCNFQICVHSKCWYSSLREVLYEKRTQDAYSVHKLSLPKWKFCQKTTNIPVCLIETKEYLGSTLS